MNRSSKARVLLLAAALFSSAHLEAQVPLSTFVNWETAPVHPVALSPAGRTLAVCNLPDNRVELFELSEGKLQPIASVMVGLDPVSVRFRTEDELWVANYVSDSVSIVTVAGLRVQATLQTRDEPADIVFAGSPARAFVTCSGANTVQVFDPVARALAGEVRVDGNAPRAMAVSADSQTVYAAIFRSGNHSTILGAGISQGVPRPTVVDFATGPHLGQNPPPNSGEQFSPAVSTNLPPANRPPRVGLIVKKDATGHWMDDNAGDWTGFVSGTNAVFSDRPVGWDMPDHDVMVLNAADLSVRYASGLMNICMDLAVNPGNGLIAVVGTDGRNEVRFEPALRGVFLNVELALVNPQELTHAPIIDLNPHLDYRSAQIPGADRRQSIGDPRGIVWNASGTRGYVTGMGSDNLVVIDAEGRRLGQPVELGSGPTGMALDEQHHRLYVLNRFQATVSVVDTEASRVVQVVPIFDPTPTVIRAGRPRLYSTHLTSGLGQLACASCHPDAQTDGLAWDLGDPEGAMKHISSTSHNFALLAPAVTNDFHPMKGPMLTQTLQDIVGHEPFHWRGDRAGLEEFNQTF